MTLSFRVHPIGVIRSPWTEARGTPIQPVFAEGVRGQVVIVLDVKPYVPRFDAWSGRAGWVDDAPAPTTRDDGRFGGDPGSRG